MIVFLIVFGKWQIYQVVSYPIFSYVALVPWTYFSTAMTKSTQSLIGSSRIFTKVYFQTYHTYYTFSSDLLDFFIALIIVFLLMVYGIAITPLLWLPLLVMIMVFTSTGIGLWLSSLAIQYRDVRHAIQFLSQLLMYAAPVVWPVTLLTENFGDKILFWYGLYPLAGVIEGFRSALIGVNPMPWDLIITGFLSSLTILITGAFYFKLKERFFADVHNKILNMMIL